MDRKPRIVPLLVAAGVLIIVIGCFLQGPTADAKDTQRATGVIEGTVKSPAGEPLYGILVKASGNGQNFDTTVVTDASGRYEFPPLVAGEYRVSVGTRRQEMVKLGGGRVKQDFTTELDLGLVNQTTGVSWVQAFPGTDDEKKRLALSCAGGCHGIADIMNKSPRPANRWADTMKRMAYLDVEGNPLATDQPPRIDLSEKNVEVVTQYLARVIQPAVIDKYISQAIVRPQGEAAKAVFVEWDTGWDVPERSRFAFRRSSYSYLDSTGMIWFVWHNGATGDDGIGRINQRTNEIKKWIYPYGKSLLHDMAGDADGNIWTNVSNLDRLLRFDPKTEQFKEWTLQTKIGRRPHSGDFDPQGNYWVTLNVALPGSPGGVGSVVKLDPRTGNVTEYPTLTPHPGNYGLTTDKSGNVWFAELGVSQLARIDPSGKLSEYKPPTPGSGVRRIRVDQNGQVWFTEYYADKIGTFNPSNDEITEYDLGIKYGTGGPYAIAADKFGKVWASLSGGNSIARLDPATKQVEFFLLPSGSYTRDLWPDYSTDHFGMVYGIAERPLVGRMYIR